MGKSTTEEKRKFEALYEELKGLETKQDDAEDMFLSSRLTRQELRQYHWWQYRERYQEMAYPENVIPRIKQTDFNDLKATETLRDYFGIIFGESRIPMGTCDGVLYEFYPSASSIKLEVGYSECQKREKDGGLMDVGPKVAPLGYFYLQSSSITKTRSQPAALSSSPLKRKLSGKSSGSRETDDSGYRSASVEPPAKKVKAVIPGSCPQAMAASRMHESKMDRESQAINVPTGSALSSLPGITSEYLGFILNHPFFYLGGLGIVCQAHGHALERDEYAVAVSLLDHSLWIIYDAWDDWWDGVDDDDILFSEEPVHPGPFRPARGIQWAQLPHREKRVLMGKVADDVQAWDFSATREMQIQHIQEWPEEDIVPVFINARVTNDGRVVAL